MLNVEYIDLTRRFHKRKIRRIITAAAAALAVLVVFASGAVYAAVQISRQQKEAVEQRTIAEEQREEAETQRQAAESQKKEAEIKKTEALTNETQLLLRRSLSDSDSGYNLSAVREALSAYENYLTLFPEGNDDVLEQIRQSLSAGVYSQPYDLLQKIDSSGRLLSNLKFSPDGRHILGETGSGPVLADALSGEILAANTLASYLGAAEFSPSGKYYLTYEYNGTITIFDTENPGSVINSLDSLSFTGNAVLYNAAFISDDTVLLSLSANMKGFLQKWNISDNSITDLASGDNIPETILWPGAVMSPDHTKAALPVNFLSDTMHVIDLESGEIMDFPLPIEYGSWLYAFSPDGRCLAGVFVDMLIVWDLASQDVIYTKQLDRDDPYESIDGIAFSPDSSSIAVMDSFHVRIIDITDGSVTYTFGEYNPDLGYIIFAVSFSPDGKSIIVCGNTLEVYSLTDGKLIRRVSEYLGMGADYSSDGRRAALSANDGTIGIYSTELSATTETSAASGQEIDLYYKPANDSALSTLIRTHSYDTSIYLSRLEKSCSSPSGDFFAIAYPDGYAEIWDLTLDNIHSSYLLREHYGVITEILMTDDYLLTSGYDGRLMVFDLKSGRIIHFISVGTPDDQMIVSFDVNDRGDTAIILVGAGSSAVVCDLRSGKHLYDLEPPPGASITRIGFTIDDTCAAAVLDDDRVILCRLFSGFDELISYAEDFVK